MSIQNPHRNYPFWHKVQIHCHSQESDARRGLTPAALEAAYRDAGYTCVFLTDHNRVTPDPQVPGILHIDGAEYGLGRHHALALGIEQRSNEATINSVTGCACRHISKRLLHIAEADRAIAVAAHPSARHFCTRLICPHGCGGGWSPQELTKHAGHFAGVEIFNANNAARRRWSLNRWDEVLMAGSFKTWGFASDDCHDIRNRKTFDRGWILVNSEIDPKEWQQGHVDPVVLRRDIVENIRGGNFWAVVRQGRGSRVGVAPPGLHITVSGDLISVAADRACEDIKFVCGSSSRQASTSESVAKAPIYRVRDWEDYIRIQVVLKSGEGELLRAFSQPLCVRRRTEER
ncbi:MAG: hypothetical protein QUS33_08415 [Dehalococcoidia bacterium]|nr:hypothetical protein [Dehalococcoidia bacterium]